MSQVSKYPISKEIADRIFEIFTKTSISVRNAKEAQDFAYDLFTPVEKVMLAKRIAIAYLLLKGYKYREISKLLRVSITTIGSVNLVIKLGRGGYSRIINRIAKEEKLDKFFTGVTEKLLTVGRIQRKGSAWRYLLNEVKKSKKNKTKSF